MFLGTFVHTLMSFIYSIIYAEFRFSVTPLQEKSYSSFFGFLGPPWPCRQRHWVLPLAQQLLEVWLQVSIKTEQGAGGGGTRMYAQLLGRLRLEDYIFQVIEINK